jgi:hypothetical protein
MKRFIIGVSSWAVGLGCMLVVCIIAIVAQAISTTTTWRRCCKCGRWTLESRERPDLYFMIKCICQHPDGGAP